MNGPIVRYESKFWVLEEIKNGMAKIWRNGQPALVPKSMIETIPD